MHILFLNVSSKSLKVIQGHKWQKKLKFDGLCIKTICTLWSASMEHFVDFMDKDSSE